MSPNKTYLKVSIHPNSSINIRGINSILTHWETAEGFIPDLIVIDYADILAPEENKKDSRSETNDTWKALDGMDENFFLYAEDTDLCRRAKNAGWLVGYDPSVQVSHAWGASRAIESQRTAGWHAQSLAYYFRKHYPKRPVANALLSRLLYLNAAWRGGRQHRGG